MPTNTVDTELEGDRDGSAAIAVALRIISGADQSSGALRQRLARRGFDAPQIETAMAEMTSRGYVDDERLAESIARRRTGAGYGTKRVAAELRARGVDESTIDATLNKSDPDSQQVMALETARKLCPRFPEDPRRERLRAALLRRGFSFATVRRAIHQLETETDRADL